MPSKNSNDTKETKAMRPRLLIAFSEDIDTKTGGTWVKLLYVGDFYHGDYGDVKISRKDLEHAVKNFNEHVAVRFDADGNPQLPFSYNHAGHDSDPENSKASGWIKTLKMIEDDLWGLVEFTPRAKKYIDDKEFQYQSPEFRQDWQDEFGEKHGFTFLGATLTNYNHLKTGLSAIGLMEGDQMVLEFQAPDGSFELIREKLQAAINSSGKFGTDTYPWIKYTMPGLVYVDAQGKLQEIKYTIDSEGNVSLGDQREVEESVIIKSNSSEGVNEMKEILKALGLAETTTEADAVKAVVELKEKLQTAEKNFTDEKAAREAVNGEVIKLKESKAGTVTMTEAEAKSLREGSAAGLRAENKLIRMTAEKLVDGFIDCDEPKLVPAQRERMIGWAVRDENEFLEHMKDTPPLYKKGANGSGNAEVHEDAQAATDLNTAIVAFMEEKKITSYSDAARQLRAQKPELFSKAGHKV